jgi:hypothetical protein
LSRASGLLPFEIIAPRTHNGLHVQTFCNDFDKSINAASDELGGLVLS